MNIVAPDTFTRSQLETRGHLVYFIRSSIFLKIGIAKNLKQRLSSLQTGNPEKLEVEAVAWCGDEKDARALESDLHINLKDYHERGEWFEVGFEEFDGAQVTIDLTLAERARIIKTEPFNVWGIIKR
jgi:hypothetical protein